MKKFRIVISLILVVLLIFVSSVSVFAAVIVDFGDWKLSWADSDTEFEVYDYIGKDTEVTIPSQYLSYPVISILGFVFSNNDFIKTVHVPDTIKTIEGYAFVNATALEKVDLKDGVSIIGEKALVGCTSLKTIIIPKSVTTIAKDAFDTKTNVVINCYKDSYAHKYAVTNNIKFKLLDDPQPTTEPTTEPTTQPTTEPVTETVTPTEPVKTTYIVGDGNDNGHVDISDATVVQLLLANLMVDDGYVSQRAFFIEEGKSITNATYLQMYLAKLTTPYDNIIGTTKEYKK